MHRFFQIISLFFCYYLAHSIPPYFPTQVVFTTNSGQTLYAIDQINQRAYASINSDPSQTGYVFQHFPGAPVDTLQSKYYVQLITGLFSNSCAYGTYWERGGNPFNYFPSHWDSISSFEIKNFLDLQYPMIHSTNHSVADEDYWYSDKICAPDIGDPNPCDQVYFKKNTDIPLRLTTIVQKAFHTEFRTTEYQVLSVGKPDDKYFANIPKNWYSSCLDLNLQVYYSYDTKVIRLHQTKKVGVSLSTPPHRVNGNDTVIIRWNVTVGCDDCLRWTPKQLAFNGQNFDQIQNLTVVRVLDSSSITLTPIFIGGGFDLVLPDLNSVSFDSE